MIENQFTMETLSAIFFSVLILLGMALCGYLITKFKEWGDKQWIKNHFKDSDDDTFTTKNF